MKLGSWPLDLLRRSRCVAKAKVLPNFAGSLLKSCPVGIVGGRFLVHSCVFQPSEVQINLMA